MSAMIFSNGTLAIHDFDYSLYGAFGRPRRHVATLEK